MNHKEYNYLQHYRERLSERTRIQELISSGPELAEIFDQIFPIFQNYLISKANRSVEETAFLKMLAHPSLESIKEILHNLNVENFSNRSAIDQLVVKMKNFYVNEQEKKAREEFSKFLRHKGQKILKKQ